jgi:hypothetical protein
MRDPKHCSRCAAQADGDSVISGWADFEKKADRRDDDAPGEDAPGEDDEDCYDEEGVAAEAEREVASQEAARETGAGMSYQMANERDRTAVGVTPGELPAVK